MIIFNFTIKKKKLLFSVILILLLFISNGYVSFSVSKSESDFILEESEAKYNRDKVIAYAQKYCTGENAGKNIDGHDNSTLGADCAHFVSCSIGNPPQRYLDNGKVPPERYTKATDIKFSGGVSFPTKKNVYGITSARDLNSYITSQVYTDLNNNLFEERKIAIGKVVERLLENEGKPKETNEGIKIEDIDKILKDTDMQKGDYIHVRWNHYDSINSSIVAGHAMLYAGNGNIYAHNDVRYNESFTGYLEETAKLGSEYNAIDITFIHIFDDPVKENNYQSLFKKNDKVVNKIDSVNVRSGPGVDYNVIEKTPKITGQIISGSPKSFDGAIYYLVEYLKDNQFKRGWIWEDALKKDPVPPPSDPEVKGSITIKVQTDSGENITTFIKLDNVNNEIITEVYNGSIESSKEFKRENLEPGKYRLTWLEKYLATENNTFYFLNEPSSGMHEKDIGKIINKNQNFIGKYKKVKTGTLNLQAKAGSDPLSISATLTNLDKSTEEVITPKELQKPLGTYKITWPKTFTNNDLKIQYNLSGLEKVEVTLKEEGDIVSVTANYTKTYQDKGTVKVVATLQGIPWTGFVEYELSGPEKIKGKHISTPTTHQGVAPGTYSIKKISGGPKKTYPPPLNTQYANCEIEPSQIEVKVGSEITVTFKFSFPNEGGGEEEGKGTVIVESNINAGFKINGPGFSRSSLCPFEKEDAKAGSWTVTWESYDSYNTPSTMTKVLDAGGIIKFYGNYTKKDGGGQPPPDDDEKITLTLYVHEGTTDGRILEDVVITGRDGKYKTFCEKTNSYGYVTIIGYKSGYEWEFSAYKNGYEENIWKQKILKTESRHASLIKKSGGGGGGGDSEQKVTYTLYMYENSTSGNVLPGVKITGTDGKNQSFNKTTDSSGCVQITGYKSGNDWTFKASKEGYITAEWSKKVTENVTNYGFLKKDSGGGGGGGGDNPPASTYSVGDWISIGPNVYYYKEPCGSKLYDFDYVNGYKLEDKKYCNNIWWYKIYMEDDDGIIGYAWIRGTDINGKISGPKYSIGSTKAFKKGANAYLTICGSVYDTLKYDGNEFKIIDRAYRCNTWWYKVYVGAWQKNVWFKEADIL